MWRALSSLWGQFGCTTRRAFRRTPSRPSGRFFCVFRLSTLNLLNLLNPLNLLNAVSIEHKKTYSMTELNQWEQQELDSFKQSIQTMIDQDGIIDYKKLLIAKAQLLLQHAQKTKKNFRQWTCDALCVGKNFLNDHQI